MPTRDSSFKKTKISGFKMDYRLEVAFFYRKALTMLVDSSIIKEV